MIGFIIDNICHEYDMRLMEYGGELVFDWEDQGLFTSIDIYVGF